MPDGVNIPGGPSFIGNPQPPDVPCDPAGDGWRGPPGPPGPPGESGPWTPPVSVVMPLTSNPVPPGYVLSSRYGTQLAVDIFAKTLSVPPRNTFNVLEGVLTLPATVTDYNTYHTAIAGFISNQSGHGVGYGVGAHAVAEANNCLTGAFGSITTDSPKSATVNGPSGQYSNVRLQNEFDWYTNNAGTSVRGTLNDGYFLTAPGTYNANIAFLSNIFTGAFATGTGYFNGTTMTIVTVDPPVPPTSPPLVFAAGMHLEGTGVDSTANITITVVASGGGVGTYTISANVGVVGSAGSPVAIRATSTYQWNQTFASPDGVAVVALDVGQRNFSQSLTLGDRSQYVNWRYTNVAPDTSSGQANERVLQQWVEPIAGMASPQATLPDTGGVLYVQNYLQALAPASYGIQNWNWNNAAFVSKNNANTGWIDALHVEGSDRVVLGAGSNGITELSTSAGIQVEVLTTFDGAVPPNPLPPSNAIGMAAPTTALPGRIYIVGGGNLQLANFAIPSNGTTGFVSPWPVTVGAPTGVPIKASAANAFAVYNTQSKSLNIFDPTANGWYHVTLTAGAA